MNKPRVVLDTSIFQGPHVIGVSALLTKVCSGQQSLHITVGMGRNNRTVVSQDLEQVEHTDLSIKINICSTWRGLSVIAVLVNDNQDVIDIDQTASINVGSCFILFVCRNGWSNSRQGNGG
jgi:hypothetical protein